MRRQLADLELLVDGGFFDYDITSQQVEWSTGLRRLYGIDDPAFAGGLDGWLEMVHVDDRALARRAVLDAAAGGTTFDFEHRFLRRSDGVERWAHCRGTVDTDGDGRATRLFGVSVDVTEQRRSATLLSEFIANAAHELRTPAAAIGQAVHALQVATSDDDRQVVLDILTRQATRLRNLTVNLVDLGRLDSDASTALQPVEVRAALDDALAVAPVPLDRTLDDGEVPAGLRVRAEPSQLERVLVNLLVNAWRYGGPTVRVSAVPVGDRVEIDVADDGDGVPPEVVADLFQPFRRGPQRHPEASGLGLAIVDRLLRGMGGSVEHRRGRPGAVFTVTLDRA